MSDLYQFPKAVWAIHSLLLLAFAATVHADLRTSTDYTVAADTTEAGGQRATSISYTNHGSVGGIVGISTVAAPAQTAKHGYIGQLYEVTGLELSAASQSVNEMATVQLAATQVLDDDSTITVPVTSVAWGVMAGPLSGIDGNGLATAGTVYGDTIATAQGMYAGDTATLDLNVLDSIADNFGSYASDGIGDDWQFDHFGLDNPLAAPLLDPDGDGDNNLYEYNARLLPNDPTSFLDITLTPAAAEGDALLTLSPGKAGVSYTIGYKDSLLDADWIPLTTMVGSDGMLGFTDEAASGTRKFYVVTPTRTP
ncbi:hypothetical protein OAF58_00790 [bacterium]|nr:hypothetical protein [bacterium]MDB4730001.1 hypothetical protein [bacterium]